MFFLMNDSPPGSSSGSKGLPSVQNFQVLHYTAILCSLCAVLSSDSNSSNGLAQSCRSDFVLGCVWISCSEWWLPHSSCQGNPTTTTEKECNPATPQVETKHSAGDHPLLSPCCSWSPCFPLCHPHIRCVCFPPHPFLMASAAGSPLPGSST